MSPDPSFSRNGKAAMKADLQVIAQHRLDERAARRAEHRVEADAPAISVNEFDGARAVRIRHVGWRLVVRINKTTVTVQEPNSFDGLARYPHKNIIGAKQ